MTIASRSVVYRIMADIGQLRGQMAQASASVKKLGNDVTAVGREGEKFRKGFDEMGRTAGRVGLVAAAGLGVMALKAADFESAMSNVAAATHESEQNLNRLRDAAIEAGARTQFSATEAADAITELSKAGIATADILGPNGALNGALDLAAAGQLDVAQAAELTATALTQFQLDGGEAAHVADLLAAGAGKAQGEVQDMGLALSYAGVTAADLGVSIEETSGAIALFASNGIIGERAGTSLRGMLTAITSPSEIARKTMNNLGLSMFDAQGEFIGLAGVADQLQSNLAGLTEEERKAALGRIFGNETINAANILYREGAAGVQEWTNNVNDAGFAAETARIKTDNLRGDLERLGGALDTAFVSGGQGSQGFLRELTQGATSAVDAFNTMPASLQNVTTGLLAVTAITGGSLWFGAKVINGIADARQAISDLGPAGQRAARGLSLATKGVAALTIGLAAYQAGKEAFDIGIDDDEIRRQTELIQARYGDDIQGQIAAVTELIEEQQKITGEGVAVNIGVAKLFSDQDASDAHNRINQLNEVLAELNNQLLVNEIQAGNTAATIPILGGVVSDLASESGQLTTFVTRSGRAFQFTEEQVKKAKEAFAEAKEDARGVGQEFFGLGEKVDKARVSLGDWLRDLEKQAEALEAFTANAEKAAKNGLDRGLIKSLQEAGPAGALRMQQLAKASESEIGRANRAWRRGQEAIDDYVKATTKIPRPLRVTADTSQANSALDQILGRLARVRSQHMEVRLGGVQTFATGGAVRGPGTATSDSIPAYLSNGEYVMRAAAVQRYGFAFFDRLNAMHFAQGGFVGSGAPSIDMGALVSALGSVGAPFAQSVTFQLQDMKAAERKAQEMGWRKSSDGIGVR